MGLAVSEEIYVNFRIHVDDSELMNSLKDIQSEGQDEPAYAYQPYDAKSEKRIRGLLVGSEIE